MPSARRMSGLAIVLVAAFSAGSAFAAGTDDYCESQRNVCHSLCTQVTNPGVSRRSQCESGCERSTMSCYSTGSFNFAVVEQLMPEFHKQ
jgi:hypothetical protein